MLVNTTVVCCRYAFSIACCVSWLRMGCVSINEISSIAIPEAFASAASEALNAPIHKILIFDFFLQWLFRLFLKFLPPPRCRFGRLHEFFGSFQSPLFLFRRAIKYFL